MTAKARLAMCLALGAFLFTACPAFELPPDPTVGLPASSPYPKQPVTLNFERTVIFALEDVQALREAVSKARANEEKVPHGWSKSGTDPMAMLAAFPTLSLKEGLVLRAYVWRDAMGGNGVVWAMPAGAAYPEPANLPLSPSDRFSRGAPKPDGALEPMPAIEGDKSPWSYLSSSLLALEVREFGSWWHGITWDIEKILGADPWRGGGGRAFEAPDVADPNKWKWKQDRPEEWRPRAQFAGDTVVVTFYTHSELNRNRILRRVDVYGPGSYVAQSRVEEIAVGAPGISF